MELPILTEIKINDLSNLITQLENLNIGDTPFYLDLSNYSSLIVDKIINSLETYFQDIGISPRFPYPFYLIVSNLKKKTIFPILKNKKELPKYFSEKLMKFSTQEILLNKIQILKEKTNNGNIEKNLRNFKHFIHTQKSIKILHKESLFLNKVLEQVTENDQQDIFLNLLRTNNE